MGKKLTLTLAAGTALALGIAAIAFAYGAPSLCAIGEGAGCHGFPGLSVDFGIGVVPKKLPKHELAPVAVELRGKISTADGAHPSALREATVDFDRNIVVNATGLPVCRVGGRDASIQKACRNSIVGSGGADFELAFPEAPPTLTSSKLTAYNVGVKAGVLSLVVVAPIDVPVPRMIAIPVEIKRIRDDGYGLRAVAKIPVIAGGSGSLIDFSLRIKRLFNYKGSQRSYAMARCPDRQLNVEITAHLKNEVHEPNVAAATAITGVVASPCTPTS